MKELHFLSDEDKVRRLDNAVDRAIELFERQGFDCPMTVPYINECMYANKWENCDPREEGYDCWRIHLINGGE